MSRMIACVVAMLAFAVGNGGQAFAQDQPEKAPPAVQRPASQAKEVLVGDFIIAEPVRCKNLTVFPILSTKPKEEDRYITLEEGLDGHKVVVHEVGVTPPADPARQNAAPNASPQPSNVQQQEGYGDVNHLMVLNRGEKPLYLMPGEIIIGGKQDRCVAKECIIPANGKPIKIDVYCVEHGRWSSGQVFAGKAGNLGKAARATVQEGKAQGEVWDSVAQSNAASGVRPSTGAFTANYTDPKILEEIKSYAEKIERPVADHRQVVGAIAAVNGKIEVVDVFGSTPLFRKVWPKLLSGYALDAAAAKTGRKARSPMMKDAEKFLRDAMEAGVQAKTKDANGLVVTKRDSQRVTSYSASAPEPSAKNAQSESGFGGVHDSGYSK
jgi:hypothetical protein